MDSSFTTPSEIFPCIYQFLHNAGFPKTCKKFLHEYKNLYSNHMNVVQNDNCYKSLAHFFSSMANNNDILEEKKSKLKKKRKREEISVTVTPDNFIQDELVSEKQMEKVEKIKSKKKKKKIFEKTNNETALIQNNPSDSFIDGEDEEDEEMEEEIIDIPIKNKQSNNMPFHRIETEKMITNPTLQDISDYYSAGDVYKKTPMKSKLSPFKGHEYRHEKTKKKRGSYRGNIDLGVNSLKFSDSE